jgi:putative hemolysin
MAAESLGWQLLLIVVLILINAFFASAEIAVVSLNRNHLQTLVIAGNKKAIMLDKLLKEPTKFLSTIQVGVTFASLFSSAAAATSFTEAFGLFLLSINIPYGEQVAFILITLILSYFTLVFGELFPKRVALQHAEGVAFASVRIIVWLQKLTKFFVNMLTFSTNTLLHLFGIKTEGIEEKISREEIKSMVEVGEKHGVFNKIETEMITSIFEFDDIIAEQIMTPRTKVFAIDINRPISEYIDEILSENYSRIPVYDDDIDQIIGVLYLKDYFYEVRKKGFDKVDIRSIIHPPYFVPEKKKIDVLFREMQKKKVHISFLIDEYGGFSGLVTMEDLIEEIMGEIDDEYDSGVENRIMKLEEGTYEFDAMIPINELNKEFHFKLEENADIYDSLGGFMVHILGRIPKQEENAEIKYKDLTIKVKRVVDNRIERIVIQRKKGPDTQKPEKNQKS